MTVTCVIKFTGEQAPVQKIQLQEASPVLTVTGNNRARPSWGIHCAGLYQRWGTGTSEGKSQLGQVLY